MWNAFVKDYGSITPIHVEEAVCDDDLKYAGRVDMVCTIESIGQDPVLLDIKTGCCYPHHDLQVAAYARTLNLSTAILVYLDSIIERNPSQQYNVRLLKENQLAASYLKFDQILNEQTLSLSP